MSKAQCLLMFTSVLQQKYTSFTSILKACTAKMLITKMENSFAVQKDLPTFALAF
jgi:hypothetical protein